jgi:hypothetical protein
MQAAHQHVLLRPLSCLRNLFPAQPDLRVVRATVLFSTFSVFFSLWEERRKSHNCLIWKARRSRCQLLAARFLPLPGATWPRLSMPEAF